MEKNDGVTYKYLFLDGSLFRTAHREPVLFHLLDIHRKEDSCDTGIQGVHDRETYRDILFR